MRVVTVTDNYHQEHTNCLLISTQEDLEEYKEMTTDDFQQEIAKALHSKVPVDRWDHLFYGEGQGRAVMRSGVTKAVITGGNPIFQASGLVEQKFYHLQQIVERGDIAIINRNGGFFTFDPDRMSIISDEPYVAPSKMDYVTINDDTRIINLENDPELEEHSIKFMEARDQNYSYIRRLDLFDDEDLVMIFRRFKSKGGTTVYVFTTGCNVPQMHEYAKAIVHADIKEVIFEFNSGVNEEIQKVITYLRSKGVNVDATDLLKKDR